MAKHDDEEKKIAEAFVAMKNNPEYLKEMNEIDETLNDPLPDDPDNWWKTQSTSP